MEKSDKDESIDPRPTNQYMPPEKVLKQFILAFVKEEILKYGQGVDLLRTLDMEGTETARKKLLQFLDKADIEKCTDPPQPVTQRKKLDPEILENLFRKKSTLKMFLGKNNDNAEAADVKNPEISQKDLLLIERNRKKLHRFLEQARFSITGPNIEQIKIFFESCKHQQETVNNPEIQELVKEWILVYEKMKPGRISESRIRKSLEFLRNMVIK